MLAKSFTVEGVVQGVNYRVFAMTCAGALGVKGWVTNRADGSVEVHAEGEEQQLAEFEFDLSRGARYARVSKVEAREVPLEGFEDFKIRR